MLDLSATPV